MKIRNYPKESNLITVDILRRTIPKKMKDSITEEMVNKINTCVEDPYLAEGIRENFVSYTSVLQTGRYSMDEYLNAIMYISYRLSGENIVVSYAKTFPDRYQKLVDKGTKQEDICSYAKMYSRGKLVIAITEQAMIPSWLLNQDAYQKAINTQVNLMTTARSERVRAMAADSILNHLKRPEASVPAVNIDMRETQNIADLKKAILDLAQTQKNAIAQGVSPKAIVETEIVDGEYRAKEENAG